MSEIKTLRCLTIYQPWASLIMAGIKIYETRKHVRFAGCVGEVIGIHAAETIDKKAAEMIYEMPPRSISMSNQRRIDEIIEQIDHLPRKHLLGTVLVRSVSIFDAYHHVMGSLIPHEYCAGLFCYEFQNPCVFKNPISRTGKQGIWKWQVPEGMDIG